MYTGPTSYLSVQVNGTWIAIQDTPKARELLHNRFEFDNLKLLHVDGTFIEVSAKSVDCWCPNTPESRAISRAFTDAVNSEDPDNNSNEPWK